MPIQTEDIKLLKSAVMADVPEGGGAMTGIAVLDGQSNNLFPDTSTMDRAKGRVNARKLFGAAHTDDTDTLMGAHAIVTQPPADPLVHCSLMKTPGWADIRLVAQDGIEKYLVKGPRLAYRIYDRHYAGSLVLRLVSMVGGTPPAAGDAICLANPDGADQYLRILKIGVTTQTVAVVEGNGTVLVQATVATCEIGNPLAYDFFGPPPTRVGLNESAYAQLYSTSQAGGAKFYGIKTLGVSAAPGDYGVMTQGGIYATVVPAATVESPIIDVHPFAARKGLTLTATTSITLDAAALPLAAGSILVTPAPIRPASLSLNAGGTSFLDDGLGNLKQGALVVGSVDYLKGSIQFLASSPNYGAPAVTLTYTPATTADLSLHSSYFPVSSANQGRAYTNVLAPLPAPGSVRLSFMVQGRWYEMTDNLQGKLAGSDASYGTGTIDYATGSMAITLGALPDVGSALMLDWGEQASAAAVEPAFLPARLGTAITLPANTIIDAMQVAWSRGGTPYTATVVNGVVAGDATGHYGSGSLWLEPNVFPDSEITVSGKTTDKVMVPGEQVAVMTTENSAARIYQLPGELPIAKNTFKASVPVTYPQGAAHPENPVSVYDRNGVVWLGYYGNKDSAALNNNGAVQVGTINYATGVLQIDKTAYLNLWLYTDYVDLGAWIRKEYWGISLSLQQVALGSIAGLPGILSYAMTPDTATIVESTYTQSVAATAWKSRANTYGPAMLGTGVVFKLGGENYTLSGGVLRKGWSLAAGTPLVPDAGVFDDSGTMTVTGLPASGANGITWVNAVQNAAVHKSNGGVFRTASAPLKVGVMQLLAGALSGSADDTGAVTGGISGTVDFQRGLVTWTVVDGIDPATLSYNAVFLQYLPLDKTLLGLDTVRLPLDGRVPIFRSGDLVVVHHTLTTQLPNRLVKGTAYDLGRVRIASVRVKDALGAVVPSSLYVSDLNPGKVTVPVGSDITGFVQPLSVEHRIEDVVVCAQADISGQLKFVSSLTHPFPAGASFVSSALEFGDLFARTYNALEQNTWTGAWSDSLIGAAPSAGANFNEAQYPIVTTNRGAITERWALIFAGSGTGFRIVGESVGDIGTGNTATDCAPVNPATGAPYFTLPALGWGNGWAAGNVLRFNTAACGSPFWIVRTVLQGPASVDSDVFSIAFRGDVDRP